jgi:hypothetical protein
MTCLGPFRGAVVSVPDRCLATDDRMSGKVIG